MSFTPRSQWTIALAALIAVAGCGQPPSAPGPGEEPVAVAPSLVIATLDVDGMTCEQCSKSINALVAAIPGVTRCQADHVAGRALVEFDPEMTSLWAIADAISAQPAWTATIADAEPPAPGDADAAFDAPESDEVSEP